MTGTSSSSDSAGPRGAVCVRLSSCCSSSLPRGQEGDEEASCGVGPALDDWHFEFLDTGLVGPACCCSCLQPGQCSHPWPRPAGAPRARERGLVLIPAPDGEATGARTCSLCVRSRRVSARLQRRLWCCLKCPLCSAGLCLREGPQLAGGCRVWCAGCPAGGAGEQLVLPHLHAGAASVCWLLGEGELPVIRSRRAPDPPSGAVRVHVTTGHACCVQRPWWG